MFLFAFAPVIIGLSSLNFFQKLLFSQFFSLIILFILISFIGFRKFIKYSKSFKAKQLTKLFLIGTLRVAMSLCFFYALSNGPRIENNIITLTWPIFLVVFNILSGEQKTTASEILSILMAFFGSSFIFLGDGTFSSMTFSHYTYYFSILYALLGGFYYYLYKKTKDEIFPSDESIICGDTVLSHLMMVFWQCAPGLVIIIMMSPFFEFSLTIPSIEIVYMLLLGILGYSLPQVFLSYSNLSLRPSEFAVLRYLNPVICTLYLYYFLGDTLYPSTIIGTTLILTCIYIVQVSRNSILNAQAGSIYFAIIYTSYIFYKGDDSGIYHELETYGAIFSIILAFTLSRILAFTLSRIHQKINREQDELIKLNSIAQRVYSEGNKDEELKTIVTNLMQKVYDFDFYYKSKKVEALAQEIIRRTNLITKHVENRDANQRNLTSDLESSVTKWLSLKVDKVTTGEKTVIWLLGAMTVITLSIANQSSLISDATIIIVSTTIFFLCWLVRDYDLNIPNKTFSHIALAQNFFKQISGVYYIPRKIYLNKDYPKYSTDFKVKTTTSEWSTFEKSFLDVFTFYISPEKKWEDKKSELQDSLDILRDYLRLKNTDTQTIEDLSAIESLLSPISNYEHENFKDIYRIFLNIQPKLEGVRIDKKSRISFYTEKILILIGFLSILYVISIKHST
jgi:drug/metabolite transporter (DMT)-like permease